MFREVKICIPVKSNVFNEKSTEQLSHVVSRNMKRGRCENEVFGYQIYVKRDNLVMSFTHIITYLCALNYRLIINNVSLLIAISVVLHQYKYCKKLSL